MATVTYCLSVLLNYVNISLLSIASTDVFDCFVIFISTTFAVTSFPGLYVCKRCGC